MSLTDKERAELMNARRRIVEQRKEINRLFNDNLRLRKERKCLIDAVIKLAIKCKTMLSILGEFGKSYPDVEKLCSDLLLIAKQMQGGKK